MNIALILSSGVGRRFGKDIPKQYCLLIGKPVVDYVIEEVKKSTETDKIIVVCSPEYEQFFHERGLETCNGGSERNISLRNGLEYIKSKYQCEKLIVLDAVRPFIKPDIIDKYFFLLNDYEVVATCNKITDSLGSLDFHVCDRERYYLLSSPEAFRFPIIDKYLDQNSKLVEVYQQMPPETTLFKYFDFRNNYKVTYQEDIDFITYLLSKRNQQ